MNDMQRREQNLPSKIRLRKINVGWLKMIECLKELLEECDNINGKRGDLFLKLVDLTKELRGPHLIMDSILLSKDQLQEHLDALKVSWENEFNEITEYSEEEVEKWLIRYVNKNEDVEDMLHQLNFDIRDIEKELFNARIKHETTVSPMQEYIELWLKKALIKITELDQPKLVTTTTLSNKIEKFCSSLIICSVVFFFLFHVMFHPIPQHGTRVDGLKPRPVICKPC
jgi:hypothetical protein